MPSWQARLFNGYVRLFIRRRDWGDGSALVRRARRRFRVPRAYQHLARRGLRHERIRGEWLAVPHPDPGVLLYVHGGGYVSCSSATHRPITAALARLTGRRVFSADYRTAPEARFPSALEEVLATYVWLLRHGAPGERIAVAGESAGGGLVIALAVHARDAGWPSPACVVAFSPWTDLAGTGASLRANDGRCAMFHPENIPAFASVYLDGAAADDPRASPFYADLRGLPPVLLQVGSTELLLDDARRVHERIVAGGGASQPAKGSALDIPAEPSPGSSSIFLARCARPRPLCDPQRVQNSRFEPHNGLTIYDGVLHGWQLLVPFMPEARQALREAADFVRSHIERPGRVCSESD